MNKYFVTSFAVVIAALLTTGSPVTNAAGSHLDYTFASNGIRTTTFGANTNETANTMAVQSNGKMVVAGTMSFNNGDFALCRYNTDGTLDTTFGNGDGKVTTDFFGNTDYINSVAIQSDGKIVVAGTVGAVIGGNLVPSFGIARYNTDGSLDTTFSGNGKVFYNFTGGSDQANAVAIQGNGKIVVAGVFSGTPLRWGIARLNADGSLDSTYGNGGRTAIVFANSSTAYDLAIQSNGKILIGGTGTPGDNVSRFALIRQNSDGTLDTTFNGDGSVLSSFGGSANQGRRFKLMSDGKIALTGYISVGSDVHCGVARYNTDGTLDTSFGGNGKVVGPVGHCSDVAADNGDVFIAGETNDSPSRFLVARFSSDGMPDPTFGTGGVVRTNFVGKDALATSVKVSGGKVIVAGYFGPLGDYDIAVARYKPVSRAADADLSGDGKAEYTVFRPSSGTWYSLNLATGTNTVFQWGLSGDIPSPGDYDGDGYTDAAVFRPSTATFYILYHNGSYAFARFGLNGDKPVAGDYDGDGITDVAVFRPSNGFWYVLGSHSGFTAVPFGISSDSPTPADFDGDGKTDMAVFRPGTGTWYILRSSDQSVDVLSFGLNGDRAYPADYDGDGKADIAIWRPSDVTWWVLRSSDGSALGFRWGTTGDIASPADFDGDGKADYTVFRPSSGIWYVSKSTDNGFLALSWGSNGDVPLSSAYIP